MNMLQVNQNKVDSEIKIKEVQSDQTDSKFSQLRQSKFIEFLERSPEKKKSTLQVPQNRGSPQKNSFSSFNKSSNNLMQDSQGIKKKSTQYQGSFEMDQDDKLKKYQQQLQIPKIDLTVTQHANIAIEVLKKSKKSKLELEFLYRLITNLSIFKDSLHMFEADDAINNMNKSFSVKYYPKLSTIFEEGDIGTVYYIVLKGKVSCLIKQKKEDNSSENQNTSYEQDETNEDIRNRQRNITTTSKQVSTKNFKRKSSLVSFDKIQSFHTPKLKTQIKPNLVIEEDMPEMPQNGNKIHYYKKMLDYKSAEKVLSQMYPNSKKIVDFGPGKAFGEISLITNQRRTATMVCEEDTYCMELTKSGYDRIVGSYQKYVVKEKLQFFQKYSFFSSMPDAKLLSMMASINLQKYKCRDIIFKERDTCDTVYFIKSGEIEFSKYLEIDKKRGKKQQEEELQLLQQDISASPNHKIKQQPSNEKKSQIQELKELNHTQVIKDKQSHLKRINLIYLSSGSYFGNDELVHKKSQRVSKAIVKSLDAEIYTMSSDFFLNTLKVHNAVDTLKIENDKQLNIEENRVDLIEKIGNQTKRNFEKKVKLLQIKQKMGPEYKEQLQKFKTYIQVKEEVKSKKIIKKKNNLKLYNNFPVIEKQPIPVRFTIHKYYKNIKEEFKHSIPDNTQQILQYQQSLTPCLKPSYNNNKHNIRDNSQSPSPYYRYAKSSQNDKNIRFFPQSDTPQNKNINNNNCNFQVGTHNMGNQTNLSVLSRSNTQALLQKNNNMSSHDKNSEYYRDEDTPQNRQDIPNSQFSAHNRGQTFGQTRNNFNTRHAKNQYSGGFQPSSNTSRYFQTTGRNGKSQEKVPLLYLSSSGGFQNQRINKHIIINNSNNNKKNSARSTENLDSKLYNNSQLSQQIAAQHNSYLMNSSQDHNIEKKNRLPGQQFSVDMGKGNQVNYFQYLHDLSLEDENFVNQSELNDPNLIQNFNSSNYNQQGQNQQQINNKILRKNYYYNGNDPNKNLRSSPMQMSSQMKQCNSGNIHIKNKIEYQQKRKAYARMHFKKYPGSEVSNIINNTNLQQLSQQYSSDLGKIGDQLGVVIHSNQQQLQIGKQQ